MTTVLIVEDNGLLAFDLETLVQEATGANVLIAYTLRQAEEAGAQLPDSSFALLDIELPDGTSLEFARNLRERHVPFAFLSASTSRIPADLRAFPCIVKPFARAELTRLIRSAVGQEKGAAVRR